MTKEELAKRIDHAILKPETLAPEVHRAATEALQNGFASICVAPVWVARVSTMVREGGLPVCAVIGFPHGTHKSTLKAIEATSTIKDGADEIDVVAHLPNLINHDFDAARQELMEIVRAARATRRQTIVKVIIESAYLLSLGSDRGEGAIATACRAICESGCDFVKTSTGFHPAGGASVEQVRLICKYSEGLKIKAAGGIRTLAAAQALLAAGADRLGASASVAILAEVHN
jgi:deoxyribose-phosphate aldolase